MIWKKENITRVTAEQARAMKDETDHARLDAMFVQTGPHFLGSLEHSGLNCIGKASVRGVM